MGNLCLSCCQGSSTYEDVTPDLVTRRRMQLDAAEKRLAEQQGRGIKNMDVVKKQERMDKLRDKHQDEAGNMNVPSNLKWQVS